MWIFSFHDWFEQKNSQTVDFRRLISLLYIVEKYGRTRDERATLHMVEAHCHMNRADNQLFEQCTDFELERLLNMACRKENTELIETVSSGWAGMLMRCSNRPLKGVLSLADRLGLLKFRGDVCYVAFVRISKAMAAKPTLLQLPTIGLGARQHAKLCVATALLWRYWGEIGAAPIRQELGPIHPKCASAWRAMWNPVCGRWIDPVESLGRFSTEGACKKERCAYRSHAMEMLKSLLDSIPNRFT